MGTALTTPELRPQFGRLYGITHAPDGTALVREPKILRVGIGLPKGPAVNVWLGTDKQKPWRVRVGYNEKPEKGGISNYTFATREETEKFYWEAIKTAPECPYPRKTPYFCFTRRTITPAGAELFVPDFYAIESHGPAPTEIDVVFLKDNPFDAAYQMWSRSELKCKGDGLVALRNVSMATAEQKKQAEAIKGDGGYTGKHADPVIFAILNNHKTFVVDKCWTNGCPFAGKECKVGADLSFQLAMNIRVGGTAYFHTTSIRSASQIFSSLYAISSLTGGRLAMVPMKMLVRPFRSNHDGKPATHYAISFEFRAQDVEGLQKNLIEQAANFRQIAAGSSPVRQIEAGEDAGIEDDEVDAEMMDAEFGAEDQLAATVASVSSKLASAIEDSPRSGAPTAPASTAATGTATKTSSLMQKLKETKAKIAPGEDASPDPVVQKQDAATVKQDKGDLF